MCIHSPEESNNETSCSERDQEWVVRLPVSDAFDVTAVDDQVAANHQIHTNEAASNGKPESESWTAHQAGYFALLSVV